MDLISIKIARKKRYPDFVEDIFYDSTNNIELIECISFWFKVKVEYFSHNFWTKLNLLVQCLYKSFFFGSGPVANIRRYIISEKLAQNHLFTDYQMTFVCRLAYVRAWSE